MHLTGLFILRRTQEVINKFLPPKKESILFCRPTVLQLALYRTLLSSQVVRSCLQGSLENSPHLICIGALKKLCNHPCLLLKAIQVCILNYISIFFGILRIVWWAFRSAVITDFDLIESIHCFL